MKHILTTLIFTLATFFATITHAQDTAWIQIEAQPSLRGAQERARAYSGVFENVNGFSIGSGWYSIALGPFTRDDAERKRRELRRENLIPRDSYISDGNNFRQQFWPIGANSLQITPVVPATPPVTAQTTETAPVTPQPAAGETPREARKSETALSRDEKKLLQVALQWEGFYKAAIDGSFGRGTRSSMAAYQNAHGYEPTGILTTKQRATLLADYNAILAGIGLASIREEAAGIDIDIPTAMVKFSRYEPPFVHFDSINGSNVRVLLISQSGDQNTLFGLYDIMQTLEIVPLEGARERKKNSFTLTGENSEIISYTYAELKNGMVKGFTLIWPVGDEKRRGRVIAAMKASFASFGDTALADDQGADSADQRIDLVAGLSIRQANAVQSGFYIDNGGRVLTSSVAIQNCERITIDDDYDAKVALINEALGIAILKPVSPLSPSSHANFRTTAPRLKSEVAVSGYSYGGALGSATLTFGTLADIRGLQGQTELRRLALAPQDGDAGGPVFDMSGSVLGMLLPPSDDAGKRLPADVSFAISAEAMGDILAQNGVTISASDAGGAMAPEDLTLHAIDMTVLVSCWN